MPSQETVLRRAYLAILFSIFSLFVSLLVLLNSSSSVDKMEDKKSLEYNVASLDMLYYPNDDDLFSVSIDKSVSDTKIRTKEDEINDYVYMICEWYSNVSPNLVQSIIYEESRYNPNAKNGNHIGLMQVSSVWHAKRAENLGVKNLYDSYGNILVGVDYLNELILSTNGDIVLSLMIYNMGYQNANRLYSNGLISSYALNVLSRL